MMGEPKTLSPSTYVSLGPTKSAPKVALPSVQDTDAVEGRLERDSECCEVEGVGARRNWDRDGRKHVA